jgi:hypothetical protein
VCTVLRNGHLFSNSVCPLRGRAGQALSVGPHVAMATDLRAVHDSLLCYQWLVYTMKRNFLMYTHIPLVLFPTEIKAGLCIGITGSSPTDGTDACHRSSAL